MARRVLVTGASGFVGRSAAEALRSRGFEVHGVARARVDDVAVDVWHEENLLDPATAPGVVRRARASHLLHLAWTTAHGRFWSDPANRDWIAATSALMASFAGVTGTRAVMSGSCAQYDWASQVAGRMSEEGTPRRPATLYGEAKQAATEQLESWSNGVGLSYATALVFFPYGPFEQAERLVPSVTAKLLAGDAAETTAGTQVRDFVHIRDCGAALAALVDSEVAGPVNVASGEGTSVADVATAIARIVGREDLLRIGALPGGESSRVVADVTRLREEVGFASRFELETGLRDAVEWWRVQRMRRR